MNAKQIIIKNLKSKHAKFTIYTDIAYGRGINGVGYEVYRPYEEIGQDHNPKTIIHRTFDPMDDCLVITENYEPPKIPWNRAAEKEPYTLRKYIGYDRITYISESVED